MGLQRPYKPGRLAYNRPNCEGHAVLDRYDAPARRRKRMVKLTGKKFVSGALLAVGIAGLAIGQAVLQNKAEAQGATVQAPRFVVDPLWPKPLPNNWLLAWTIGL